VADLQPDRDQKDHVHCADCNLDSQCDGLDAAVMLSERSPLLFPGGC
jgi:hypothetical protein